MSSAKSAAQAFGSSSWAMPDALLPNPAQSLSILHVAYRARGNLIAPPGIGIAVPGPEVELIHSTNPTNSSSSSKSSMIIAVGVIITMLYFGRHIFIPLAMALVLSVLLTPLAEWLERLHLGRVPAVIIVLVLCLAVTATIGWGVAGQLVEITTHVEEYKSNLEQKIHSLHSRKSVPIIRATTTVQELNKQLAGPSGIASNNKGSHPPQPIPVQVTKPPTFIENARSILGPLTRPVEIAVLVIVFMAFMLINREDLRNRLIRLGGQGEFNVITQALQDASAGVSRYLSLLFLVNACYGSVFGVALYFIGVPHALLWGALIGLLRFVPYVGVWIGVAFPAAMALAVFPGWKQALLTFVVFAVLELVTADAIEPWLYGSHTGISPLAILVAAVFWATLWGPVGLILSTPLTLCLVLVGRYVPQMSFLEILLGDAPALRSEELFYQRLLAMDEDEARNVAENYLKENSLAGLYESVLIPALRLAEEDRHTDVLGDRSAEFISQSTRELIEDMGERIVSENLLKNNPEKKDALANDHATNIVCVPARDEADELVGVMLSQLLRQAGYTARYVASDTVEHMLVSIAESEPRIICISALPPFAVGQARALCKRIQSRFQGVPILVGLWGFAGGEGRAQDRIGHACTDSVATSLSEALLQVHRFVSGASAEPSSGRTAASDESIPKHKNRTPMASD